MTHPSVNLCVVRGECSTVPEVRELPSGARLATVSVRARRAGARATSVPVALWDPPAWVDALSPDDEVVVVGRVERRFFRAPGGGAGSRVEVTAETVSPGGDRRRVAAALRRAEAALTGLRD